MHPRIAISRRLRSFLPLHRFPCILHQRAEGQATGGRTEVPCLLPGVDRTIGGYEGLIVCAELSTDQRHTRPLCRRRPPSGKVPRRSRGGARRGAWRPRAAPASSPGPAAVLTEWALPEKNSSQSRHRNRVRRARDLGVELAPGAHRRPGLAGAHHARGRGRGFDPSYADFVSAVAAATAGGCRGSCPPWCSGPTPAPCRWAPPSPAARAAVTSRGRGHHPQPRHHGLGAGAAGARLPGPPRSRRWWPTAWPGCGPMGC